MSLADPQWAFLVRLGVAAVLGLIVGAEREARDRPPDCLCRFPADEPSAVPFRAQLGLYFEFAQERRLIRPLPRDLYVQTTHLAVGRELLVKPILGH